MKITLSVLPETTVTDEAVVVAVGAPVTVELNVTVTLAGGMVPLGKPCPVTLMLETPASPEVGDVAEYSVTDVVASRGSDPDNDASTNNTWRPRNQQTPDSNSFREFLMSIRSCGFRPTQT